MSQYNELIQYLRAQSDIGENLLFFDEGIVELSQSLNTTKAHSIPQNSSPSSMTSTLPRQQQASGAQAQAEKLSNKAPVARSSEESFSLNLDEFSQNRIRTRKKVDNNEITTLQDIENAHKHLDIYNKIPSPFLWGHGPKTSDNASSRLMVISWEPAKEDIQLNSHWSGDAGELLRKMLAAIHVTKNTIYSTTLIKKSGMRVFPRDIQAFLKLLKHEINLVQPKAILLFGEELLRLFSNNTNSLLKQGASAFFYEETPVHATYDPHLLLLQPALKRPAWAHLQALENTLKTGGKS
jgi:uracil-DNA glycosylase family 4